MGKNMPTNIPKKMLYVISFHRSTAEATMKMERLLSLDQNTVAMEEHQEDKSSPSLSSFLVLLELEFTLPLFILNSPREAIKPILVPKEVPWLKSQYSQSKFVTIKTIDV